MKELIATISFVFTVVGGVSAVVEFIPPEWTKDSILPLLLGSVGWLLALASIIFFWFFDKKCTEKIRLKDERISSFEAIARERSQERVYLQSELSKTTQSLEYVTSVISTGESPIRRQPVIEEDFR